MKVLEDIKKMPIPFLIGACFIIFGFLINLIGFSLPSWNDSSGDNYDKYEGLWRRCTGSKNSVKCIHYDEGDIKLLDWFMATRAFAVLGLMTSIASLVLVIIYVMVEKLRNQLIYIINVAVCFVTAGCILLSVLVYEAFVDNLSTGWAFSVIALLSFNSAGALLFKEIGSKKVDLQ